MNNWPSFSKIHLSTVCMWFCLSRMQRIREGIHIRTMKAKRKVEEISKEDVQAFLKKNAFVLFTVGAVIVGVWPSAEHLPLPSVGYWYSRESLLSSVQESSWDLLCARIRWPTGKWSTSPFLERFWWGCCRCWSCLCWSPAWLQVRHSVSLDTGETGDGTDVFIQINIDLENNQTPKR